MSGAHALPPTPRLPLTRQLPPSPGVETSERYASDSMESRRTGCYAVTGFGNRCPFWPSDKAYPYASLSGRNLPARGEKLKTLATLITIALTTMLPARAGEHSTGNVVRLSEPVEVTADYEVYGSRVDEMGEVKRLAEIIGNEQDFLDKRVFVEARVAKVCQKKGCWFLAHDGDAVARITFIDYSFFVPTDSGGKDVTIVGTFSRSMLSEKKARHYAEDGGTDPSAIMGPQPEYSIVATSVVIPRS